MTEWKETAINFGPSRTLVGILARPATPPTTDGQRPAVVILNAGVLHRVGPHRVHVRLARRLAEAGFTSFRIDLPGVGDSEPLDGTGSLTEDALRGIDEAFSFLSRKGVADTFVLFGLCSGADLSFLTACHDPRVVGIAIVDPTQVFVTRKARLLHALNWFTRPGAWLGLFTGRYRVIDRLRGRPVGGDAGEPEAQASREDVEKGLRLLVDREVRICYMMTRDRRRYRYRRQLLDAFPDLGLERLTELQMFPDADHTFPSETHRVELKCVVVDWVRRCWGTPSTETGPAS